MKTTRGVSQETGQPFEITETESQDSASISLTAKGEAQVEVKAYAETLPEARERATQGFLDLLAALRDQGVRIVGDGRAS